MSISRSSQVFMSQGDPVLGFGAIARVIGGGLFKRGASKAIQIARSPAGRAIGGIAAGALGAGVLERVFGGRGRAAAGAAGLSAEALDGFIALRRVKTGKLAKLISPSGKVINLHRRAGGISARELRGFRKVASLLGRVGMRVHTGRRRKR